MQVSVTFRHVNTSAGLRSYASEKVERLEKFAHRNLEAHVILSVEKLRHRCEIQLVGKGLKLTATEETGDLYSAIDLAADKVERQLKRRVGKGQTRKGATGAAPRAANLVADSGGRTTTRIRPKRVAAKPMSVDEAILQFESSQPEFLVFRNSATESLSVLYRRKDGAYGLVEPS